MLDAWDIKTELERKYHDEEWGKVVKEDRILFEFIILEAFASGLSWRLILSKRSNFKKALYNFDASILSRLSDEELKILSEDEKLIRHKAKIQAIRTNAKVFLNLQKEFGSFYNYLWGLNDFKQVKNNFTSRDQIPKTSPLAIKIAKDFKKQGFKFFGNINTYSYLQAIGLVDDRLK